MPEVGDRDDDQQVKSHSQQRDATQQDVKEKGLSMMLYWLPARGVK